MDIDKLLSLFHRIVELVRSSSDPFSCWSGLLKVTDQISNPALTSLDVCADIDSLAAQLHRIFIAEPLPAGVTFLWFGLFDLLIAGDELEGYYVSGWTGTSPDSDGPPIYLPKNRYLTSSVLNGIKDTMKQIERSARDSGRDLPEEYHVLDYAAMFGAAALLTKFVILSSDVRFPVYVGFDSGDWALIANTPPRTSGATWPIIPQKKL